jgi:hypothetical protein
MYVIKLLILAGSIAAGFVGEPPRIRRGSLKAR